MAKTNSKAIGYVVLPSGNKLTIKKYVDPFESLCRFSCYKTKFIQDYNSSVKSIPAANVRF
jgi:hypothetical protein